ncbi:basic salivary proline-rich protein 4-like [Pituophis catenifer annectens]|uniref:basic salivary proline-rich protein 4-like n=1 Tax=Pituophis catenifer annectens TaxID=94852 RepID=UPI003993D5F9
MSYLSGSVISAPDGIGYPTSYRNSGHRAGTSGAARTRLLFPPVRDSEVVGGMEDNSRPQVSEPTGCILSVQDAVPPVYPGGHPGRRLPLVNRPDGGLSPCPHPFPLLQVPPFQLCESSLSIPGPSIRPILGSLSFHEIDGRASESPPNAPHKNSVLPGRPSGPVQFGGSNAPGPGHHPPSPGEPRIFRQLGQEPIDTHDSHPTSTSHHRFCPRQGVPFSGPPIQSAVTGPDSLVRETCFPGIAVSVPGKDGLLYRHHPLGAPPLQGPAVVPAPIPEETTGNLQPHSPSSTQGPPVPPVVALGSCPQGARVSGTTLFSTDHRCQPSGLGSSSGLLHGARPVDPGRSGSQHKLARAPSHPPGSSGILGQGTGQTHSHTDRQCGRQGPSEPPRGGPALVTSWKRQRDWEPGRRHI